ncbi:GNAT family N-acetyltransferase [Arthrobacter sp. KK5.5]|uniref:GNAT family N-acetyltransferase n=1 Tax=Arthrobacter sp. KK5.5 TaxID=3373084 RepID=UPI003EE6DF63
MDNHSEITVRQNDERGRYELLEADRLIGKAHWIPFDDGTAPARIFFHTVVDEEFGGRGLASKLARFALDDTVAAGLQVVPVCPYIKAYVRKHPELQEHSLPVRPEHLAAVERVADERAPKPGA